MKILVAEQFIQVIGGNGPQPSAVPMTLEEEVTEPEADNGSGKLIVPGVGGPGDREEQDTLIDADDKSQPLE